MSDEARALGRITRIMDGFPEAARSRMTSYLAIRYGLVPVAPLTSAERSARYRENKRHGARDASVTPDNGGPSRTRHDARDDARHEPVTTPVTLDTMYLGSSVSKKPERALEKAQNVEIRQQAKEILAFLNEKAGKSFREIDTNLRFIETKLRTGVTISNCKGVIVRKVRDWKNDPKMTKYLRPATLFNATNFEQYLGEREAADARE